MDDELNEMMELVIDIAGSSIDRMLETELPAKVAKLAKAYFDAFIEEEFPRDDAYKMVYILIKNQSFPHLNQK